MRNIDTKQFEELKEKYGTVDVCEKGHHQLAREIYCGGHTGDYICLKCYLSFNECDKEKHM